MSIHVKSTSTSENTSCPYCKGELNDSEPIKTCDACQTSLHEECAKEMGRCTTVGCEQPFEFDGSVLGKGDESASLANAESLNEEFVFTSAGRKYCVILNVLWTIYLAYVIGDSAVVEISDFDEFFESASTYFFLWGMAIAYAIDIIVNPVITANSDLDKFSAKWAWLIGVRIMLTASIVAYPIGTLTGSALATRIVFCSTACISYFYFSASFKKELERQNKQRI